MNPLDPTGSAPPPRIPQISTDQILGNPILNQRSGFWEIAVMTAKGSLFDVFEYPDEETAQKAMVQALSDQVALASQAQGLGAAPQTENRATARREKAALQGEIGGLEDMFTDFGNSIEATEQNNLGVSGDLDADRRARAEEIKAEKAKFEDTFTREERECAEAAKSLLISISKVFLHGFVITEDSYMAHKMQVEQLSLSGLLFQLKTSRRAIHKLSQDIHLGTATPRQYEVLAQLQRVVLDISKFQHEYMISLEASVREIAEDLVSRGLMQTNERKTELGEALEQDVKAEETVLSTRHRREVTNAVRVIMNGKDLPLPARLLVPSSRNSRLQDADDEEITEADHLNYEDESMMGKASGGAHPDAEGHGLATFEDQEEEDDDERETGATEFVPASRRPALSPRGRQSAEDDDDDYAEGDPDDEEEEL